MIKTINGETVGIIETLERLEFGHNRSRPSKISFIQRMEHRCDEAFINIRSNGATRVIECYVK